MFPRLLCQSDQSRICGLGNWWIPAIVPSVDKTVKIWVVATVLIQLHTLHWMIGGIVLNLFLLPAPLCCLQWPDLLLCLCSPVCCPPSSFVLKKCSKNCCWMMYIHPYRSYLQHRQFEKYECWISIANTYKHSGSLHSPSSTKVCFLSSAQLSLWLRSLILPAGDSKFTQRNYPDPAFIKRHRKSKNKNKMYVHFLQWRPVPMTTARRRTQSSTRHTVTGLTKVLPGFKMS